MSHGSLGRYVCLSICPLVNNTYFWRVVIDWFCVYKLVNKDFGVTTVSKLGSNRPTHGSNSPAWGNSGQFSAPKSRLMSLMGQYPAQMGQLGFKMGQLRSLMGLSKAMSKGQGHIHGIISCVLLGRGGNIIVTSSAETTFLTDSACFCTGGTDRQCLI